MISVNNIKLNIDTPQDVALEKARKLLGLSASAIQDIWAHKVSIDARKGDVKFVYSVAVRLYSFASSGKDWLTSRISKVDSPCAVSGIINSPLAFW